MSGGEKFLASVSLALGLADVIQMNSGAIELDTLFIDEGFGTLSDHFRDLVLEALDAISMRLAKIDRFAERPLVEDESGDEASGEADPAGEESAAEAEPSAEATSAEDATPPAEGAASDPGATP